MSKYNISIIVFTLLIIMALIAGNAVMIIAVVVLFISIATYGSFSIQSNFYISAVNRSVTDQKSIVISFDDGPSIYTPVILDILKEFNCKAVFFCIGNKIKGNESILKRIVEEGHQIGNHTFYHSVWFDFCSSRKMEEEIMKTEKELYEITGVKTKLFRPPYGVTNPMLAKAIRNSGNVAVGWSKRSLDTVIKDKKKVLKRILRNLRPGDIILLHDTIPHTTDILREFLEYMKGTEYKVEKLEA